MDNKDLLGEIAKMIEPLSAEIQEIKNNQLKTDMIIENEIQTNIKLIAEGHMGIVEKLEKMEYDLGDIKETVAVLKVLSVKK